MSAPAKSVEDFTKWAHHVANHILPASHPDHDDVVQEGLIAIALVLADKPDPSAVYLAKAGRRAMLAAAYDGKTTGLPDRRLRSGPPPAFADSLEGYAEAAPLAFGAETSLSAIDPGFSRVEWASLRPGIDEALEFALDDRDRAYVHARFTEGLTDTEIAASTNRTAKAVSNRWASVIRPHLTDYLSEFAEHVA